MRYTSCLAKLANLSLVAGVLLWGHGAVPDAMAQLVDCDDPAQSLSGAIQAASPGDTIQFVGTCSETVTITTDRLTIDAGGGGGTIDGGGVPGTTVITVDGARDVRLLGLTVQNGTDGIAILRGASAVVRDVLSQNHADDGIAATDNATLRLEGRNRSANNGDDGISITFSSSLSIGSGSTVEVLNNGDDGLQVFGSSALRITGTVLAGNNGVTDAFGDGIQVSGTSTAFISNAEINSDRNASRGISLSNTSYFLVSPPSTVTLSNNGRDGLGVFTLSRFNLSGASELRSESNRMAGILVSSTSIVSCSTTSSVVLDGNDVPVNVSDSSSLSAACEGAIPAAKLQLEDAASPGEVFGD